MSKPLTADDLLKDALDALEMAGCIFWACKGPDVPPQDMITCCVCREIRRIRKFYERQEKKNA